MQKLKERKFQIIAAGSALAAAIAIFAFYKYKTRSTKNQIKENDSEIHQYTDRLLFEDDVSDKHQYSFVNYALKRNSAISDIQYKIIFNLNKGNLYQGVVKIAFNIKSLKTFGKEVILNFNGSSIKHITVNGTLLNQQKFKYHYHEIVFSSQYLKQKQKNKIEIIYQSKYSFLDQGLSSYFILDQSNKYSLRQQVIYTKNGPFQIEKIIPCFNCLNQCKVSVQIIYPEGFQAFSNSPKSLERYCSAQQYPQYSFFFTISQKGLNKSFKLNSSFNSNFDGSTINLASAATKKNTHFYPINLKSIHHLFIFSSSIVEIRHSTSIINTQNKILVRYFGKSYKAQQLQKNIATLHRHVIDIINRLKDYKIQKSLTKIDVFFVADRQIQGYYAPGVIMLDEQTISSGVHIKIFYLIARAILGMIKLSQKYSEKKGSNNKIENKNIQNDLSLQFILELNEEIFYLFPQCRGYLFFKQMDCEKAKNIIAKKEVYEKYSLRFMQYYFKQVKFLLKDSNSNAFYQQIPFEFKDIYDRIHKSDNDSYWSRFISQYNFLSPYVAQIILKISIQKKGIPFQNQQIINFAKQNFKKSKFYLDFFTNEQIQQNLPYFLQNKFHHLQKRLTEIKIKQKFRQYIPQQYESYLPIKANRTQVKSIYDQFKRFKQSRNFHHVTVLKKEIKRICMFGKQFILKQKCNLDCGIMSWKLMKKIKIQPGNSDYKKIINELQNDKQIQEKILKQSDKLN